MNHIYGALIFLGLAASVCQAETWNARIARESAALESRWSRCLKLSTERAVWTCLRETALAAASLYDRYDDRFCLQNALEMNPDERKKRVAAYMKIQANWIKYRERHCEYEEAIKLSSEFNGFVQKARCHFRTALQYISRTNAIVNLKEEANIDSFLGTPVFIVHCLRSPEQRDEKAAQNLSSPKK